MSVCKVQNPTLLQICMTISRWGVAAESAPKLPPHDTWRRRLSFSSFDFQTHRVKSSKSYFQSVWYHYAIVERHKRATSAESLP